MPEKKQGQVILMSEQQMKTMPILAMRDVCVLPGMLVHLDVSREITKRAIEEAMAEDGSIFLTLQRDESIETPSSFTFTSCFIFAITPISYKS